MKVAVFGAGGMLANAVVGALAFAGADPMPFTRAQCDVGDRGDVTVAFLRDPFDALINCAGVRPGGRPSRMALANAAGPHLLAQHAQARGVPMVHVSTDCVFGGPPVGVEGGYDAYRWTSASQPSPLPGDLYGLTKWAGEPVGVEGVVTVRTSFIGTQHGLLRWLIDAAANMGGGPRRERPSVPGFKRAMWSGGTVHDVAGGLVAVLLAPTFERERTYGRAVHLATENPISKYDLLCIARDAFGLAIDVVPTVEPHINRALFADVKLPPVDKGLAEMAEAWKHGEAAKAGG